ncbi:MAG: (2Fe-2S)-binding protein [Planctomycetes bacterium]|nr:(2Fe-2S)-binding protein [Planctomycetota bacterium]
MGWDFRKLGERICVCYDVSNQQALEAWQAGPASVGSLTQKFRCGSNCGMCIPYFHTLLREYQRGEWPAEDAGQTADDWFGANKA